MLKIRLARVGRKKLAQYRVVVSDSSRPPAGGFVEQLGHYDPHTKELNINAEKTQGYIDQGTQLSSRMVKLLQDHGGITLPQWALKNLLVKSEVPKDEEDQATGSEEDASEEETSSANEGTQEDDTPASEAEETASDSEEEQAS